MPRAPRKPAASLFGEDDAPGPTIEAETVTNIAEEPAAEAKPAPESAVAAPLPSTDLVLAEPARGTVVLLDVEKFDQFEQRLRDDLADFVPDVTTDKGRREIASQAFRVTKVKTALAGQAKALTEEWRRNTAAVNDGRKTIVTRLQALADEVRRPLDEWEAAEEKRIADNAAVIAKLVQDGAVQDGDTSETVAARGREIWAMEFPAPQWDEEQAAEATIAKNAAIAALVAAQQRLKQAEIDAAELAELRRDREERQAREAEEARQRELRAEQEAQARQWAVLAVRQQADLAPDVETIADSTLLDILADDGLPEDLLPVIRAEADRLWNDHLAAEGERHRLALIAEQEAAERERERLAQIERERAEAVELAAQQAREQAQREAKEKAEREQQERDAAHAEELRKAEEQRAEAQRVADELAAKAKREQEERDAEAKRQQQEAARIAEEDRKRAANQAHRKAIMGAVKAAMIEAGDITEEQARVIVLAIVGGNVPHCTVAF
jgi:colicin import membrane protein